MSFGCVSADSSVGGRLMDKRIPPRSTYLYQWCDSDMEFTRSANNHIECNQYGRYHPRVVDNYYCRQMYLRSYTFSKKETNVAEKTTRCLGKVKEKVAEVAMLRRRRKKRNRRSGVKILKETSCSAIYVVFQRLLLCTASVDVVDI